MFGSIKLTIMYGWMEVFSWASDAREADNWLVYMWSNAKQETSCQDSWWMFEYMLYIKRCCRWQPTRLKYGFYVIVSSQAGYLQKKNCTTNCCTLALRLSSSIMNNEVSNLQCNLQPFAHVFWTMTIVISTSWDEVCRFLLDRILQGVMIDNHYSALVVQRL